MKKTAKIVAIVLAVVLIGGVLVVTNAFVGNPVSKMLASHAADKHLKQHYAATDFEIKEVAYNFKTGGYYARVVSPSSMDTYFSISTLSSGKVEWDSYEDMVLRGRNTMERISTEYRAMVEQVFDAPDFPYVSHISFGDIQERYDIPVDSIEKEYGLDRSTLVLDQAYDVRALAKQYGSIVFYAQDEEVSVKRASEILLDVTRILDEKGVPFYAIDFVLEKPRNEDDTPNRDQSDIRLTDFLYQDIHEEGLTERVQQAHNATMAYFAEQDAKK